jgi:hypothetical protein
VVVTQTLLTPAARFAEIVEELSGNPDVTRPSDLPGEERRFGSAALKVHNKIFAMLVKGRLVVKLSRQRVDQLIASGDGERFDPGTGRIMKEWLSLHPVSGEEWLPLATEAMEFVAPKR